MHAALDARKYEPTVSMCHDCKGHVADHAACAAQRVQCCEVCGVVAHDGACARKAAHDCKPVSEASDSMVHLWQPAGTIFYDSEVSSQTAHPKSIP